MSNDEGLTPSIAWFSLKCALAVAWFAIGGWVAMTLLHSETRALHIAAALALIALPVIWLIAKIAGLRRADEAQVAATLRGLAQGLVMACVLPGAMIGGNVLSSLFLGAGEVNVSGMMQNAVTYIAILPPIAFFLSELFAFAMLMTYARKQSR
ncbi:MAG: hypothetical protein R3C30_07680 [Hyphomonadaceae bacterium]